MNHWTAPRRADVDPWAVTRFSDTTEAWELCAMQKQAADEQAASKRWHAQQPQHGTEGCADTSDDDKRRMPEGGFIALMLACAAVAGAAALAIFAPR